MDFEKILELVKAGKKVDSKTWKALTKEQRAKVAEIRSQSKPDRDKDGIPWKNDWRFYALNEQIARDFGSIPYNVMAGVGIDFNITLPLSTGETTPLTAKIKFREMCVAAVKYISTPGHATQKTDGINMAATQLYTFIRRANSGARNYEAADVIMFILSMSDIYLQYFELKRALGVARLYAIENHFIPDLLLRAMGIDASDLRANIAKYRGQLNLLAEKINAFAVPSYFKRFLRIVYIASKIFADSTSIRGQFYVFRSSGYYTWSTTTSEKGTELVFNRLDVLTTANTMESRLGILSSQLDALFLDDDANTISGDILKAFGNDKLFTVEPTSEDYVVMPTYDEDIMAQIENSISVESLTGNIHLTQGLNITQEGQLVTYNPSATSLISAANARSIAVLDKYIFNSHKDNPDYTDTLEWTRLMCAGGMLTFSGDSNARSVTISDFTFGQEIVEEYEMWTLNSSGQPIYNVFNNINTPTSPSGNKLAGNELKIMQFDWHPTVYAIGQSSSSISYLYIGADLKKFTQLGVDELRPLHDSAVTATLWADDLYKTASAAK